MSREMKFRYWDTEVNKFYYPDDDSIYGFDKDGKLVNVSFWGNNGFDVVHLPDLIIQQYTGLKDKNGKEIYEGDVVECNSHMLATIQSNPIVGFIEYRNGCFFINDGSVLEKQFPMHSFSSNSYYKIVDNIFENHSK